MNPPGDGARRPEPTAAAIAAAVAAAQAGEAESFDDLVRWFADRLIRYLAAGGLSLADAEDVAQDAFIRAYRHLDRYDPRYAFSTWLFTIAHRLRCNHFRRQRPQVCFDDRHQPHAAPERPERDPLADTIWATARQLLPQRQFDALWLRYGEELELEEVARVMAISAGNARVLVHRARTRLAKQLSPQAPTDLATA